MQTGKTVTWGIAAIVVLLVFLNWNRIISWIISLNLGPGLDRLLRR
jgi:hypothetical protein